jgi:Flagellar protein FliT
MAATLAGWERLVELAARERDLAAAGRWEELDAAGDERAALAASLGDPPPAARRLLECALALQEELVATILRARTATLEELGHVRRGRSAVQAYAGPARCHGWLDLGG